MKKYLSYLLIIVIAIAGILGWKLLFKRKPIEEVKTAVKTKTEVVNQLPLNQRPYIIIEPKSQTRPQDMGSWLTVTIDKAGDYKNVEYEVEYQAGNIIQGFMHRIDFSKETSPFSKEGFFGSESKGKYKYDENVTGGNILFKLSRDESSYDALKTFFNLQNMGKQNGVFTSNDVKASLEVGVKDLDAGDYLIIASTLGLPAEVEGKVISEPYGFYSQKPVKLNQANLTIKSKEDLVNAKILGWDGSKWQEYESETTGESVSAQVDRLGTYVLVVK